MGEGEKGKRIIPKWGIKKEFRKFLNDERKDDWKEEKEKKGKEEFDKFDNYSTIDGK